MAGMNLSSSLSENKTQKTSMLSGSLIVMVVLVLFLVLWGGMKWYMKTLDDTLLQKKMLYEQRAPALKGDNVDRVATFDTRMTLSKKQSDENIIDTDRLLGQIENLVIPNVRLTKYSYDQIGGFVLLEGVTDNFKYVAQQLISLKGESLFSGVSVGSIKKDSEGMITFSLKAEFQ